MNVGWGRQSYKDAIVRSCSSQGKVPVEEVVVEASTVTSTVPASKQTLQPKFRCGCNPLVFLVGTVVSFVVTFSPVLVALVLQSSTNATLFNETETLLRELMKHNYSECLYPLAPNHHGGCFLPCSEIDWITHPTERIARKVLSCAFVVLTVVPGIVFTLVWIKLGKSFWKFPHILAWYMVMVAMGLGIVDLIDLSVGIEEITCSSDHLLDALTTPKPVCFAIGLLYHYFQMTLVIWITAFCGNLWWAICYPTQSKLFFANSKCIYITESIVCWTYGAVFVAICYGVGGPYQPTMTGLCLPPTEILYMTTYQLPMNLCAFVSFYLLLNLVMSLRKHDRYRKNNSMPTPSNNCRKKRNEIGNLKITFFVIAIVIALFNLLLGIRLVFSATYQSKVSFLIRKHIVCLLETMKISNMPEVNCPEEFRKYQFPVVILLNRCTGLLGALTIIHYVLTMKRPKKLLISWIKFPFECLCKSKERRTLQKKTTNTAFRITNFDF